jgi:putative membrane protein
MTLTYGNLLALFLGVPILMLALLTWRDRRRKDGLPVDLHGWSPFTVLPVLIIVAVLYTLPWDSHLIALRVWWYDPARINGLAIGGVPFEEVAFFVLQTLLAGLWLLWLARHLPRRALHRANTSRYPLRLLSASVGGCLWLLALVLLLSGWRADTYLGWELVWALPPIILQLAVGADILWRQRRLLCATIFPLLLYLSLVDALAIHEGIWRLNRHLTVGMLIGGQLPVEEFVFFLLTTLLVVFGFVLGLSTASKQWLHAHL